MPEQITMTAPEFPLIRPGDNLADIILEHMPFAVEDGDIIALAQKVVSKAEGRYVALAQVSPSPRAIEIAEVAQKDPRLVELILAESREILRVLPGIVISLHRKGWIMANAGIDASNIDSDDDVLLLPLDPDASAAGIREVVRRETGRDVGVLINDSWGRPWRMGSVGFAVGAAGIPALVDMRGEPDLRGRFLQHTDIGIGDELASAASLLMGQANEGRPMVVLRGFRLAAPAKDAASLIRPAEMDLFR
jgi:coenzyme F420-0:L-glutamate ligase/coenzyme F420-1:gamma-L-glutamate ligase